MDSLLHLILNATYYILYRLSLFSGSFLKLSLGKRKRFEICSKTFLFRAESAKFGVFEKNLEKKLKSLK